jgi:hypothetical protein
MCQFALCGKSPLNVNSPHCAVISYLFGSV